MKDKNLPDDNNHISVEELTKKANQIIEQLEKEKNLENSLDNYQELIKLNNIIEKKFQKKSKEINQLTKEKINKIIKYEFNIKGDENDNNASKTLDTPRMGRNYEYMSP